MIYFNAQANFYSHFYEAFVIARITTLFRMHLSIQIGRMGQFDRYDPR